MIKNILFVLSIGLASCSALEGEQKSNVNEIIKTQEIKQIKRADLLVAGENLGAQIVKSILSDVKTCALQKLIRDNERDSLQQSLSCIIKDGYNHTDFGTDQERMLFDAYQYNVQNQLEASTSVQFLCNDSILFTYPIIRQQKETCPDSLRVTLGMLSIKLPVKTVVNKLF